MTSFIVHVYRLLHNLTCWNKRRALESDYGFLCTCGKFVGAKVYTMHTMYGIIKLQNKISKIINYNVGSYYN